MCVFGFKDLEGLGSSAMSLEAKGKRSASERTQVGEGCPICLEPVTGEAFLDQCFHRFCYHCILQWSEMVLAASLAKSGNPKRVSSLECPLCKTHYTSVIHDFVSGNKFRRDYLLSLDGSRFHLSEAHKKRQAVYSDQQENPKPEEEELPSAEAEVMINNTNRALPKNPKFRVVQSSRWLTSWVRRELQALMQEEDVDMVTHHIVGIVEFLQKQAKAGGVRRRASSQTAYADWHKAVSVAVQPFVFENARKFAEELWRFLASGIDIAFYDQLALDGSEPTGSKRSDSMTSDVPELDIYDDDLESCS